jgi:enolase-phosphatase E1
MNPELPRVYLLDVEGTVAPLTLTTDVLFPYARAHFEPFLWQTETDAQARIARGEDVLEEGSVWRDLMALGLENTKETDAEAPRIWPDRTNEDGPAGIPRTVSMSPQAAIPKFLAYIHWLMDRDRKSTALKSLQGKIWKAGFASGDLKGTLFPDVPAALERWAAQAKVAIYSSGSTEAQQLLFRYSTFGDLAHRIAAYFDTRTGAKTESASYAAIARILQVPPHAVLFFSDMVRELDPAREAGCQTRLVVREGNSPVEDARGHVVLRSFDRTA